MIQLLQAMFSSMAETWHGPTVDVRAAINEAQKEKSVNSAPSVKGDPYADDIHRLEDALNGGRPFEKGSCIDITLQDILQIISKRRRRVDAYRGLVSRLNKMGVTLTITSNKTKLS
jgi:ribosomal protein L19